MYCVAQRCVVPVILFLCVSHAVHHKILTNLFLNQRIMCHMYYCGAYCMENLSRLCDRRFQQIYSLCTVLASKPQKCYLYRIKVVLTILTLSQRFLLRINLLNCHFLFLFICSNFMTGLHQVERKGCCVVVYCEENKSYRYRHRNTALV